MAALTDMVQNWAAGERPDRSDLISMIDQPSAALVPVAAELRDQGHGDIVTYSRKVFIPLTHLCRDVCHYCTFATPPKKGEPAYLTPEQVLEIARAGQAAGCREALFTLGDKPELRYNVAADALAEMGYGSTLEYLAAMAKLVFEETGLFPHLNPGLMTLKDVRTLRDVSISSGIMLETVSPRLSERGMPHFGSPDKEPAARLDCITAAGEGGMPFTSGILIGIGETREERIDSLLALRELNDRFGHIQEIIVQNFRAKPDTKMADAAEPDLDDLLWTIAVARILFGPDMNIQAPPNLSPGVLPQLIDAGINDWGGVSPVTPDFVNPEAPWPHLEQLAEETRMGGKVLAERLALYPSYVADTDKWLAEPFRKPVLDCIDGAGLVRDTDWAPGINQSAPVQPLLMPGIASDGFEDILARAEAGELLSEDEIVRLFQARDWDFKLVTQAADRVRIRRSGDEVSYVVTRNINYTNICYFKCRFCAFAKGKLSESLRGQPYDLGLDEVARRVREAWARGASEVCMQGGIHPDYTGQTYLDILKTVKSAVPGMHVHAFSPLEIAQGAATLDISIPEFLQQLKAAGLGTLPGTAAEILDEEVREILCPDKLTTDQWLDVVHMAHQAGFKSTATIMFGHIDGYQHWARHLLRLRALQQETGGFTELVPLPFVHMEAPIYLQGRARRGPTWRETLLMHAVARLVLNGVIDNIQVSWVKLGKAGASQALRAGANDLGGTLMNETISRAAGADFGEELPPVEMEALIRAAGRLPRQRHTDYSTADPDQRVKSFGNSLLSPVVNAPARRYERDQRPERLVRPALDGLVQGEMTGAD